MKKIILSKKTKTVLSFFLKIFVSIFFFYLLNRRSEFNVYKIFEATPRHQLFLILLFNQLFMCIISASKWSFFQKQSNEPIFWGKLFLISWVSQTVGMFAFGLLGTDGFRLAYLRNYEKKTLSSSIRNIFWDRLSSLSGLIFIFSVGLFCLFFGIVGLSGFLILFFVPKKWRYVMCLGTLLQATKTISLIMVLIELESTWVLRWFELIFPVSVGLSLELVPISFEGLGWGHITFFQLIGSESGTLAYNGFFQSKVAFKSLGAILLIPMLFYWRRSSKALPKLV